MNYHLLSDPCRLRFIGMSLHTAHWLDASLMACSTHSTDARNGHKNRASLLRSVKLTLKQLTFRSMGQRLWPSIEPSHNAIMSLMRFVGALGKYRGWGSWPWMNRAFLSGNICSLRTAQNCSLGAIAERGFPLVQILWVCSYCVCVCARGVREGCYSSTLKHIWLYPLQPQEGISSLLGHWATLKQCRQGWRMRIQFGGCACHWLHCSD